MGELFIELFSEEIPARLQAKGAAELARLVGDSLGPLAPSGLRTMHGPRRIALAAEVAPGVAATSSSERGPRVAAPEQAVAGFLRKHGADHAALRREGDFWVLDKTSPAIDAASLIADALPGLLRRFTWPKSMRWGFGSALTWIRPLRRIVCLLDGAVVPFALATQGDDGHGLASGDLTEGHRVHGSGPFAVRGFADWQAALQNHRVVADAAERAALIRDGIAALAASRELTVVQDDGLIEEVAGLVEWPVPLLGRIDDAFMDLPPEVMQVSMRVNQRYFALRDAAGRAAPWFAFAANVAAPDGGAAIVAGNERVLRARFSDARHFWDLDRHTRLADRVAALDGVVFQAELGSQGDRVRRLVRLAEFIAPSVGADVALAGRAAWLCKADLTTGMVGEFPELQGVMGGYYAAHDGEDSSVAAALRDHYSPRGPADSVPMTPVAIAVALADKLDQLAAFFSINQQPTGSGDPFGLRRAALGIIRIARENGLRFSLRDVLRAAIESLPQNANVESQGWAATVLLQNVLNFVGERLRVQFKGEDGRPDVLLAVAGADDSDDIVHQVDWARALSAFLLTPDGANLFAAYKRVANILRIEQRKDKIPCSGRADPGRFQHQAEHDLQAALDRSEHVGILLANDRFADAMSLLAGLLPPLDRYFEAVMVNDDDTVIRKNRLSHLTHVEQLLKRVAHFAFIEA